MTKQISNHAHAAKLIRAELKKHGIKGRVRASSASMTSSVDVYLENALPATEKLVEEFANQFQYGSFNGMEDIYEYTNSRDDIPQVKYVFVHNDFSDEMKQKAWDYERETYADCAEAPEAYEDAMHELCGQEWASTWVHRILGGHEMIVGRTFWTYNKPRVQA